MRDRGDEESWLRRVREGDAEAYAPLVERYQTQVIGFILRFVRHRETAEDMAQEVFLKAYQSIRTYAGKNDAAFSTWLLAIARNACIDASRRKKWPMEEISEQQPAFAGEAPQVRAVENARFHKLLDQGLTRL